VKEGHKNGEDKKKEVTDDKKTNIKLVTEASLESKFFFSVMA
jgi:hypothetical protein